MKWLMDREKQHDDAACFAMGLVCFEPPAAERVVRLLCRPSFHPPVCVTMTPQEIVSVALVSGVEPSAQRMPEVAERAVISEPVFERVCEAFDRALDESRRPPKWVVICDGMGASASRVIAGQRERWSGRAANDEERQFVKTVLSLALSKAQSPRLRNRIAWCGWYVSPRDDHAFPIEPEPSWQEPQVSRLVVLGSAEDRADFHALVGAKVEPTS